MNLKPFLLSVRTYNVHLSILSSLKRKETCMITTIMSFDEERRADNNNRGSSGHGGHAVHYGDTRSRDPGHRDRGGERERYERQRDRDTDHRHKRSASAYQVPYLKYFFYRAKIFSV